MIAATAIVSRVLAALNEAAILHMLVGSFARNYYADPRSTKDADLVLSLSSGASMNLFIAALRPDFSLNEQITFETNTGTMRSTLVHTESGFEVELFHLSNDGYDQERFRRRRAITYEGQRTATLTAEDVIVTKLRWARGKDLEDVRDVIAFQGVEKLDWNYIHHWTEQHGTRAKLDAIQASIRRPS